jgi:hypothetical protein
MRRVLKVALLAVVPVAALTILGSQFGTTVSAAPAPATPGGLFLSDLRGGKPAPVADHTAAAPAERLVVDMTSWEVTSGSGFRR